jgi:uncharacterized protein (TIGR03083 family)
MGDPRPAARRMSNMTDTLTKMDYRALYGPMIERLDTLGRSLSPDQWKAASLCDGWRVCDIYGHMTYGGITPMRKVLPILLFKHRGNLNRGSAAESVRYANRYPQPALMAAFVQSSNHPVGIGKVIKPADLHMDHIVHELDIRRPLGLASEWSDGDLRAALEAAVRAKSPLIAPAKIAKGLHLVATDLDWSYGPADGADVSGPAESLLLALCGRPAGLADLSGDGLAELTTRIRH